MAKPKKPKRNVTALAEINEVATTLLLRELQFYRDSGERVPSALLSAAMGLLKTQGIQGDLEQGAREEAQEAAAFNYVPRVSARPEYDEAGAESAPERSSHEEWSSLSAFCAARGITEDDTIKRREARTAGSGEAPRR
jgi:hypothetical protein